MATAKKSTRRSGGRGGSRGRRDAGIAAGAAHVVSVGIAPAPEGGVIDALIDDIRPLKPARVVAMGSEAARGNADRLFRGLKLSPSVATFVALAKPAHLDEVYRETSEAIGQLEADGFTPKRIGVHFTAGTKVMSSAMVLAAVSHGCERLRYLAWQGQGEPSKSIAAAPRSFRAEGDVRLAETLLRELRFRSCADVLDQTSIELLRREERARVKTLRAFSGAYASWDNFRLREFLRGYRSAGKIPPGLADLEVSKEALASLRRIVDAEKTAGAYPVELIYDLINNAVRRLAERRTDDAMTRLYRSAELFAQRILSERHKIRTDDVDIRKVPPRHRVTFEALRRLDDIKIKIGLRKSFDLLAYLEDPVGLAFQGSQALKDVLEERRRLVLAHGVHPASSSVALVFIEEFGELLSVELPGWRDTADRQQFPWIDNARVLAEIASARDESATVSFGKKES